MYSFESGTMFVHQQPSSHLVRGRAQPSRLNTTNNNGGGQQQQQHGVGGQQQQQHGGHQDRLINLQTIQRIDPCAVAIIDRASHTALYKFNQQTRHWEKTDVEGCMFVYQRVDKPFHSIFIANRQSLSDFIEPLTSDLQFKAETQYLFYCKADGSICGFWYYDEKDCARMDVLLNRLVTSDQQQQQQQHNVRPATTDNKHNVLHLLSNAQMEFEKTMTPSSSSSTKVVRPTAMKPGIDRSSSGGGDDRDIPAVLQLLFEQQKPSNPPTFPPPQLKVEELEKNMLFEFRDNNKKNKSNRKCSTPLLMNQQSVSPQSDSTRRVVAITDGVFDNTNATDNDDGPLLMDEIRRAAAELTIDDDCFTSTIGTAPASDRLLTPADFLRPAATINDSYRTNNHPATNDSVGIVPLNKEQLTQGFIHLLKTDTEFVVKLHQAYVESLNTSISHR